MFLFCYKVSPFSILISYNYLIKGITKFFDEYILKLQGVHWVVPYSKCIFMTERKKISKLKMHSWDGFTENLLWKSFLYITNYNLRNMTFLFTGQFYLTKAFNPVQKSIGTLKSYREWKILNFETIHLWKS